MQRVLAEFAHGELMVLGGVGIVIAALLLVVLRLLLPPGERRTLAMPAVFLVLHVVAAAGRGFLDDASPASRSLRIIAVLLLLLSIGRSSFLLLVDYVLGRRVVHPLPRIIRDIVQGLIYAAAGLITLRAAGVEPGSLLTTSALLTAVIGLSLQETLGNMFAGLAIQVQRPFEVGDWVQFDADPENVGRVVEINWRATKLQTLEQVEVIVPNGTLAKVPIRNYTKPSKIMRRSVYVQASYETPPGLVHDIISEALNGVEGVLEHPPADIVTHGFMDSGVEYWVRFFTDQFSRRDVIAGAVRDRIWYAFSREGITIPFPIRTVHMHDAKEQAEAEKEERRKRRDRILACVDFWPRCPRRPSSSSRLEAAFDATLGARSSSVRASPARSSTSSIGARSRSRSRREARTFEIAHLGAGEFFGEMSLTTGEHRNATARAVSPSDLPHGRQVRAPRSARTIPRARKDHWQDRHGPAAPSRRDGGFQRTPGRPRGRGQDQSAHRQDPRFLQALMIQRAVSTKGGSARCGAQRSHPVRRNRRLNLAFHQ